MKQFKSDIAKAKNLGAAHSGVSHWVSQRLTAVFLVPLYVWFICILFKFFQNPENMINNVLYSPFSFLALLFLINISLYHSVLGIKVIVEDYIHNEFKKNLLVILSYAITIITMVVISFALILNFIVNI